MMRDAKGVSNMTDAHARNQDVLARIDAALSRGEAAAERLDRRHNHLKKAAETTLSGLDRLIERERRANG